MVISCATYFEKLSVCGDGAYPSERSFLPAATTAVAELETAAALALRNR